VSHLKAKGRSRRKAAAGHAEARASLFPPEPENDTSDQISATMLAKISSAARDFRIIGLWRATDRPG